MSEGTADGTWITNRVGLTIATLLSAILALLVVAPYASYVLLAFVLAYLLYPAQRRLETRLGATAAAVLLVSIALVIILVPVIYLLSVAIREAISVVQAVQNGELSPNTLEERLADAGLDVDLVELYETYEDPIATAAEGLVSGAFEIAGGIPELLIGFTVTLFVLFSLLRDGDRFLAWIRSVVPLSRDVQEEALVELDRLMWASVVGNVAVAAIQAVLLGIGLAVLGVPSLVLLTVTTFVFALLPLIGAFGVWLPVSVYLLAIDRPAAAVALVLYGSLVSVSDMYLRPAVIGSSEAFNAATVVVGIFGGLVVFGAVGLFIGPVVLGGAKVMIDAFARERREPAPT